MLHGLDHRKVSFCFGSSPILCIVLRQGPQVGKLCSPILQNNAFSKLLVNYFFLKNEMFFWVPCNIKHVLVSLVQVVIKKWDQKKIISLWTNQTVVWYLCDPKKFRWLWSWHESLSNCDNYLLLLIIIIIWETHLFMTTNNILRDN